MDRRFLAGLLIVVALGAAAYVYLRSVAPSATPSTVNAPAPPELIEDPAIRFPIRPAAEEAEPLPALGESDSLARKILSGLLGQEALAKHFLPDQFVRRFVATVDNLPRSTTPQQVIPVHPVEGRFLTAETVSGATIDPDNHKRYLPYVRLLEAADPEKLVAVYVSLYPLFQSAYEELGYPDLYFNDRLVLAIDDLLAAPDVPAPDLVQPKGVYLFEDPDLESRSSGQKAMIRIGPANAARVKTRLRAIRNELALAAEAQRADADQDAEARVDPHTELR